jgi:multicomponent Na+:H+ antiporter subunit E
VVRKKAHVLVVEERLVRAFGSAADLAALDGHGREEVRTP